VDLVGSEDGRAHYFNIEATGTNPSYLFDCARTCINVLLDAFMRSFTIPLLIYRIDLFSKGSDKPFMHQIVFPYPERIIHGPMGSYSYDKNFAEQFALYREAVTASSPYYRFLCVYKLFDVLKETRKEFNLIKKKFEPDLAEPFPKSPEFDFRLLKANGIKDPAFTDATNIYDLHGRMKNVRNLLAHAILDHGDNNKRLFSSDGSLQREYSLFGSILLGGAIQDIENLHRYYVKHLAKHVPIFRQPHILPTVDNKASFKLKEELLYY
jgi:hypothetical protein